MLRNLNLKLRNGSNIYKKQIGMIEENNGSILSIIDIIVKQ